jgi:hypothetical protein
MGVHPGVASEHPPSGTFRSSQEIKFKSSQKIWNMRTTWANVWLSVGLSITLMFGLGGLMAWVICKIIHSYSLLMATFAR